SASSSLSTKPSASTSATNRSTFTILVPASTSSSRSLKTPSSFAVTKQSRSVFLPLWSIPSVKRVSPTSASSPNRSVVGSRILKMTTYATNPYDLNLKPFLWRSAALHGALALAFVISAYFHLRGDDWGGVGGDQGGVQVKLVSSNAGIPIPR